MTAPLPHRPVPLLLVGADSTTRTAVATYLAAAGARVPPGTAPGSRLAALHKALSATKPDPARDPEDKVSRAFRAEIAAVLALGPTGGHGTIIADDDLPRHLVHWAGVRADGSVSPALLLLTDPPPAAFADLDQAERWIAATKAILRDTAPLPRRALRAAELSEMPPGTLQALLASLGLWIAPRVLRAGFAEQTLSAPIPLAPDPEDSLARRLEQHANRLAQSNISA